MKTLAQIKSEIAILETKKDGYDYSKLIAGWKKTAKRRYGVNI